MKIEKEPEKKKGSYTYIKHRENILWMSYDGIHFFISSENVRYEVHSYVTRIRSTTMTNTHVITNIISQVKHEVLELSEYMAVARVLTRSVLAKLCSMAFSVESSICKQSHPQKITIHHNNSYPSNSEIQDYSSCYIYFWIHIQLVWSYHITTYLMEI